MDKFRISWKVFILFGVLLVAGTIYIVLLQRRETKAFENTPVYAKCSHISHFLVDYADRHGALPYSPRHSRQEYLAELAKENPVFEQDSFWSLGQGIVFINLATPEWEKLQATLLQADPDSDVIVGWAGDRSVVEEKTSRRVITLRGSFPFYEDKFQKMIRDLDRQMQETLGKSLESCLIYDEGDFTPGTFDLGNGHLVAGE